MYRAPLSPVAQMFLSEPQHEIVILSSVTFQSPVDVAALQSALKTAVNNFPLLRSIPVAHGIGRMSWKELPEIDINDHIVIMPDEIGMQNEEAEESETYINSYVAAMASWPAMPREKPLWDVHILPSCRRCVVIRLHHALGDCTSLLALFLASCDSGWELNETIPSSIRLNEKAGGVGRLVKLAWRMLHVSLFEGVYALYRMSDKTSIGGGPSVYKMDRRLASLTLSIDDLITVKKKLNATINDVFVGAAISAVAKYLRLKYPDEAAKDPVICLANAFRVRKQGPVELMMSIKKGSDIQWGNFVTNVYLPIKLKKQTQDPFHFVRVVKEKMNEKKKINEPSLSFKLHRLLPSPGGKMTGWMYNRVQGHTHVMLTNMRGPSNPISLKGNQVTKIDFTSSSVSTPLQLSLISYNKNAHLQFLTASEIIPDPELLCEFTKEAIYEMKVADVQISTNHGNGRC